MSSTSRSWLNRLLRRSGKAGSAGLNPCDDPDSSSDCTEVRENASDYIDGDSAVSLAQRVKNHIGLCDDCDGWVKSLATTVGLTRQLPQEEVPNSLKQKIRSIPKSE